jgi:hypothetical protein
LTKCGDRRETAVKLQQGAHGEGAIVAQLDRVAAARGAGLRMETSQVRRVKQSTAALLMVGVLTFESVSAAGAISSASTAAPSGAQDYRHTGRTLRHEIKTIYADLKKRHALSSPTSGGNDVTDVVLEYIPVGTSFDAAETILRSAGCKIDAHPADIPNPARPLMPQEPVLARLKLEGWLTPRVLIVSLVPEIVRHHRRRVGRFGISFDEGMVSRQKEAEIDKNGNPYHCA